MTGKTKSGFVYEIDERIKTDWRVIKMVQKLNSGNPEEQIDGCVNILKLMFKDGGEALEKYVSEKNDGFCPVGALMTEVSEIISSEDEIKKS